MVKLSRLSLFSIIVGAAASTMVSAQTGSISGKVVDAEAGIPLARVSVLVENLKLEATTDLDGKYSLENVPAGAYKIVCRFTGYNTQAKTVTVNSGSVTDLDFRMTEIPPQLDIGTVTDSDTPFDQLRLGSAVAALDISSLEYASASNLSQVLRGRVAGVSVAPSLNGGGVSIRVRGSGSPFQSNEPLVYLNGIRIDNSTGSTSRLDDISLDAVERIEVEKSGAASISSGLGASNGVLRVFTKPGLIGKPRFSLKVEQAPITYPDVFKPNAGFAHNEVQAANMRQVFNDPNIQPYQIIQRPFVRELFSTGLRQDYSLSVTGGGSRLTYFANGRFEKTNGPYNPQSEDFGGKEPGGSNDLFRRIQFQGDLTFTPTNKLLFRLTSLHSNVHQEMFEYGNNVYGVTSLAMFGKPELVIPPNALGQGSNPQGTAAFATVREATFKENRANTGHTIVGLTTDYKFNRELSLNATVGMSFINERNEALNPFGYNVDNFATNEISGSLTEIKQKHKEWMVEIKANWNRNFGANLASNFVYGFQGFQTIDDFSYGSGVTFPGPGIEVLDGGAVQTSSSSFLKTFQLGYLLQEQLGYRDYISLIGGVRLNVIRKYSTQIDSRISLEFVPTTALNWSSFLLSNMRVRGTIARAGKQLNAFDQLTTFVPFTGTDGAGLSPGNLDNQNLKPEVLTEWELGIEAGLLEDRLALQFSYWDRALKDALIRRIYAPSGGFYRPPFGNVGEIDTKGIDIAANFSVLRKRNLKLDFFANGAFLREKVRDLGGVPPQKSGGSYPRYRNFLEEGYAPGTFLGPKPALTVDRNGNPIVYPISLMSTGSNAYMPATREQLLAFFAVPRDPSSFFPTLLDDDRDGNYLDHYLGKPTPDWQGSFGLSINFLKRFWLNNLFEYKAGNYTVHNLTDEFRKTHPTIGRNIPIAAEQEAILLNPASTPEQRLAAADFWIRNLAGLSPFDGLNAMERADFIRWREFSLTYELPHRLAGSLGFNTASITVAGRNLALFSSYSGIDPETSGINSETGDFKRFSGDFDSPISTDAFGLPAPRQIIFSFRAEF